MKRKILDMSGIKKYIFDISGKPIRGTDVLILDDVWFDLYEGEVNVLLGENGAGKSTLMKILAGEIPHDAGKMVIQGEEQHFGNPKEARAKGVTFIHQELNLCTNLTVAQNIFMGKEYTRSGVVDNARMVRESQQLIDSLGFTIDAHARVDTLSTAQQQVVEIAKALSYDSKILIMDEPTASLTSQEVSQLLRLVRQMRDGGMGIVFISHRMDEVEQIADRVTIMKDGRTVGVLNKEEFTPEEAVKMMVGRTLMQIYSTEHQASDETVFEVRGFKVGRKTEPFDLHLKKGEILGIGGLAGQGKLGIPNGVMGLYEAGGTVEFEGKPIPLNSPRSCLDANIAFVSEDRRGVGLLLDETLEWNVAFPAMQVQDKFLKKLLGGLIKWRDEKAISEVTDKYIEELMIKCTGSKQKARELSGGNQQKICLAKAFALEPKFLFVSEPTRGIDVGAKSLVLEALKKFNRESGVTVVMISSELEELRQVCDRIAIVSGGRIAGILPASDSSEDFGMLMVSQVK